MKRTTPRADESALKRVRYQPAQGNSGINPSTVKHLARPACRPALKSPASQGIKMDTWTYRFSGRRPNRPPLAIQFLCLCFFLICWCGTVWCGGPVPCCLTSPSSPYDAPTPPNDEANLERCECAHFSGACGNGRQQGAGLLRAPCLTASLVRSLLALEQQFPTTPNNH